MYAIIALKEFSIENCPAGIEYDTDILIEVKENFDEAKKRAEELFEDPRVTSVLVVPALFFKSR